MSHGGRMAMLTSCAPASTNVATCSMTSEGRPRREPLMMRSAAAPHWSRRLFFTTLTSSLLRPYERLMLRSTAAGSLRAFAHQSSRIPFSSRYSAALTYAAFHPSAYRPAIRSVFSRPSPPTQIGILPMGPGFIAASTSSTPGDDCVTRSPRRHFSSACSWLSITLNRPPWLGQSSPNACASWSCQPLPSPISKRPPEMWSTEITPFASTPMLRYWEQNTRHPMRAFCVSAASAPNMENASKCGWVPPAGGAS